MNNTLPPTADPAQNLGLKTQTIQLNFRIKLLNNQIQSLQDELQQAKENLVEAKSDLIKQERKAKDEQNHYEYQISDFQEKLSHKQSVIDSFESKLKEVQKRNDALEKQIEYQKNQISELESQYDEAKNKETFQNKQKKFIAQLEQQNQELQKTSEQKEQQICQLRTEKLSMKEEMLKQNFQYQNDIKEFNLDLMDKKAQIDTEHKNFLESREEIVNKRKEIEKLKQDNRNFQQEKYNLSNNLQTQIDQNRVLQNKFKQSEDRVGYMKSKLKIAKDNLGFLDNFLRNQINNNQSQAINRGLQQNMDEFQKKQKKMQEELKKQFEQQHAENQKSMIQLQQQILNEQKQQAEEQQKLLKQGLQLGTKRISQAMQTHGKLDVCFLLDVTGSMDPYKEQTQNCILQSLQMIKNACNRDTYWGGICYQDFDEFRKRGSYQQFIFCEQSHELQQWLQNIKCEGGGDDPEDIRGAMKQMCGLKWPSKFKLAILICDSPCHGRRYTGGLADNYPNEDIQDAIDLLIKQNIILVGLNFTQKTIIMYQEFQKIYQARGKSELFIYADLQRVRIEDVAAQMSKWIADASTHATFTNKKGTKNNLKDQPAFQNGPTEALFNQQQYLNCLNFDKNTKSLNVRFKVLKVEIKEAVFELKIQQLYDINFPQDYLITEEGQWDCIRTERPFAQGAMKDAFLMKRAVSPNIDLYVVKAQKNKGPYRSINDAIMECRSHLICQRLMKKFQNDLERALQNKGIHKKYPAVIYSDILILEESNNKYWIAERFFNGEFVKYNNNWSYIDESVTELNKIAQSFSYYTFLMSKQNYIVVDVQGVGIYFTDPAIHTKIGHFELTDMGEEGISMYLVSYKKIAQTVSKEILQIMDLFAI